MAKSEQIMSHKRHYECDEPSGDVRNQRAYAQPLNAHHHGQPMCRGSSDAHQNEPACFHHQELHGRLVSAEQGEERCWKRVVFCGDDFGMSSGIDAGILQLIKLDRLSAISCLVHGPTFVVNGRRLNDADLDVGLHLNLTAAFGGTSQPNVLALRTLIGRVYSGRLERAWVDNQLLRQFDTFEKTLGRPPDYIDGHQHVHQLPGVLPRLLCILRERYRGRRKPWLRYTAPGLLTGIPILDSAKAHLIGADRKSTRLNSSH